MSNQTTYKCKRKGCGHSINDHKLDREHWTKTHEINESCTIIGCECKDLK